MNKDPYHSIRRNIVLLFGELKKIVSQIEKNNSLLFESNETLFVEENKIISKIEQNLDSLDRTVKIIEKNRLKFFIDDQDIQKRKQFISNYTEEMIKIKKEIENYQKNNFMDVNVGEELINVHVNGDDKCTYRQLQTAIKENENEKKQDEYFEEIDLSIDKIKDIGEIMNDEIEIQNQILIELNNISKSLSEKIEDTTQMVKEYLDDPSKYSSCTIIAVISLTVVCLIVILLI